MGRFNNIQNSFGSGELSKNLDSRTDIKEYAHGAAIVRNMKVLRHGGVTKREGLVYGRSVHSVGFDDLSIVNFRPGGLNYLIVIRPFNRSGGNLAGFKDLPIAAYYLDEARFLDPATVVMGGSASINFSWSTYGFYETNLSITPGKWTAVHYGVNLILTHSSGEVAPLILTYKQVVRRVGIEEPGGGEGVTATDDYIYVNHFTPAGYTGNVAPSVDIIGDPGAFLAAGFRIPYQSPNTDTSHNMTLSGPFAIGNAGTITSAKPFFSGYKNKMAVAKYNMRPFYMNLEKGTNGADNIYILIYNITDDFVASYIVMNVVGTWTNGIQLAAWRISTWGGNLGYPRFASIFQERLVFAGSPAFPDTMWCSYAGNIFFFDAKRMGSGTVLDTQPKFFNYKGEKTTADPFDIAIASDEVSVITWVNSGSDIRVGTLDAEYAVGNVDQYFSDTNSFVKKVTNIGGAPIPAISAEGITIFAAKDKKRIFSIEEGGSDTGYSTKNLTLLSDDIFTKRTEEIVDETGVSTVNFNSIVILGMAWCRFESVLWIWTNQSELIGLTFAQDAGTLAWHRHDFHNVDFDIVSCCVAQNRYATEDNLWVLGITPQGEYRVYFKGVYSNQVEMKNNSPNLNDLPIFLDNSRVVGPGNGSLVGLLSKDFFISESRLYVPRADFLKIGLGHPVIFEGPYQEYLPPQLIMDTIYYAIPIEFKPTNNLPEINLPYSGKTSIRFATTQANAFAGTFITLTNPPGGPAEYDQVRLDTRASPGTTNTYPTDSPPGTIVSAVQDGLFVGQYTVDSHGNITMPSYVYPTYYLVIGTDYKTIVRTLDINVGSQLGASIESIERIDRVLLFIYKSKDGAIGGKDRIFESIEYKNLAPLDTKLETMKPTLLMPNGPDQETYVEVASEIPLPLTVNGMVMRGTQHD